MDPVIRWVDPLANGSIWRMGQNKSRLTLLGWATKSPRLITLFAVKESTETRELSPHFVAVIQELKSSDHVNSRRDESFSRTILDLILADRLLQPKDQDAHHQLILTAEVPIEVKLRDPDGSGYDELRVDQRAGGLGSGIWTK
ncbi:MAG: hypothetical protein M1816_005481 [Peltula sp. TS41687]|nr:MAG: hypothetical protein M1816_005481 [Peltula sp. TS41687]